VEGSSSGLIMVLPWHFPEWTEENREDSQSRCLVSGLRFEPRISQILRCINHLPMTFTDNIHITMYCANLLDE
jgi:hypothetical protein